MRLEQVNENQIRCTLTFSDLQARHLTVSELAYNSAGIYELFYDVLSMAKERYNFNPDASPLMVEAVPTKEQELTLLISRVDRMDELDTRFARFTNPDAADGLTEVRKGAASAGGPVPVSAPPRHEANEINEVAFEFDSISDVRRLAKTATRLGHMLNSLYQNPRTGRYVLCLNPKGFDRRYYDYYVNFISEYARRLPDARANESFYEEAFRAIIRRNALQTVRDYIE